MSALCRTCGTRLAVDLFGDGMHATCDPESRSALRRAESSRRAGMAAGRAGMARAVRADARGARVGLAIIRKAAHCHRLLSADVVREDMDAAGIRPQQRGGLWQAAVRDQIVEPHSSVPSGGESAHGKEIRTYRSLVFTGPGDN